MSEIFLAHRHPTCEIIIIIEQSLAVRGWSLRGPGECWGKIPWFCFVEALSVALRSSSPTQPGSPSSPESFRLKLSSGLQVRKQKGWIRFSAGVLSTPHSCCEMYCVASHLQCPTAMCYPFSNKGSWTLHPSIAKTPSPSPLMILSLMQSKQKIIF